MWQHDRFHSRYHADIIQSIRSHTETQPGLRVLIFEGEGGVNRLGHMTGESPRLGVHGWLTDCLADWFSQPGADGVTGWFAGRLKHWFIGWFLKRLSDCWAAFLKLAQQIKARLLSVDGNYRKQTNKQNKKVANWNLKMSPEVKSILTAFILNRKVMIKWVHSDVCCHNDRTERHQQWP